MGRGNPVDMCEQPFDARLSPHSGKDSPEFPTCDVDSRNKPESVTKRLRVTKAECVHISTGIIISII